MNTKKNDAEYLAGAEQMLPEARATVEEGQRMLAEAQADRDAIDEELRALLARRDANSALIAEIEASMPGLIEEVDYLERQIVELRATLGVTA